MVVSPLFRLVVRLLAFSLVACSAYANARNCTVAEKKTADRQLWLNVRDHNLSIRTHLPWGIPPIAEDLPDEWMLAQRDYVIRYDGTLRIPLFTAERVDAKRLVSTGRKKVARTDCFRKDVRVEADQASKPADYDEAIFDQGHLAAFANQATSVVSGNNSFIMSNMAPQTCQFNRGIWQILEGVVRLWVTQRKTVFVISGSLFDRDNDGLRDTDDAAAYMKARNGTSRVAIPTAFYKIVAYLGEGGTLETLSFVLPHNQLNPSGDAAVTYLADHITSIADIEHKTGFDFFPDVAALHEANSIWPFDRSKLPNSLCREPAGTAFGKIWGNGNTASP